MKVIDKRGFTIVEAVVVGVLISIFAMGTFTLFNMYAGAQDETAAMLKLQRQADGLMDEIGRRVRGAGYANGGFILGGKESSAVLSDESNPRYDGGDSVAAGRVDAIMIRDSANVLAGFRINRINDTVGVVQIRDAAVGNDWSDFMVDGSRIEVVSGAVGSIDKASWFGLWYGRKQVSVNMVFRTATKGGKALTLGVQGGAFGCRN
jgi:type II secretory pathway pseudopilin PulG